MVEEPGPLRHGGDRHSRLCAIHPDTVPFEARGAVPSSEGGEPRRSYRFRWRLVDLDDLVTSHKDTFEPDQRFPSELQPRLRDRAGARLKVGKIARTLSPDALLLDTHQIDQGPMIVAPDLVVESGNGRTMALRMARREFPKRWREYVGELRKRLEEYGLRSGDLRGIEAPVLVRERISDVDRIAFAREANQSAVLQLSPLELALQDAKVLSDRVIRTLQVRDAQSLDQALTSPANRGLVRHFLGKVPENERCRPDRRERRPQPPGYTGARRDRGSPRPSSSPSTRWSRTWRRVLVLVRVRAKRARAPAAALDSAGSDPGAVAVGVQREIEFPCYATRHPYLHHHILAYTTVS